MRSIFSPKTEPVPAYSNIACFYDYLMRHVNYPRWAGYVIDLFQLASAGRVQRVLELACGTGKMLAELSTAGYKAYGLDASIAMVKQAARLFETNRQAGNDADEQANHEKQTCRIWCGDMRNFALTSPVDAVICLYDSFNYCLTPQEVSSLLNVVANAVRRGGLFIFDVCTQRNCRKNFRNYYERDELNEISYIRRAYFKPRRKLQINEFIIINERAGGAPIYERHEQRIYSLHEICRFIDPAPWSIVGCFDGMSRRSGTERSDRIHFVLKRL